ncbi:UPF0496 protein At1g20180-like [Carica papaya]|uniref:UPF0496 protein At1g20180-like n=1 Tax=Carica papaya TaxID=3649 RepID=UPI000B8D00BA|nr:UPF0496 protein At1g20180-like [Carica papaya]
MKNGASSRILNVKEEYLSALRTKSYADFFSKAQSLFNRFPSSSSSSSSSSPSTNHHKLSEILLEPGQDTIPTLLESALILSKLPQLKLLILDYFDISAEASKICSHLLATIKQTQHNHRFIQRAIDAAAAADHDQHQLVLSQLRSFTKLSNPFSNLHNNDYFKPIHDKYSSVLNQLKVSSKKVTKRIKIIKCIHTASGVGITAACGLLTIAAICVAAHTLTAIVMGPAIFSFPAKVFKKAKNCKLDFLKNEFLRKIREQLDAAAKGTYILNREFDTMSRLVARLHDEVEHNKKMIGFYLDQDRMFSVHAVVKELKKSDVKFRKQMKELEEHVYLCLVTINRARSLGINQMISPSATSPCGR